jgi:dolichyl-diphosphooligosaccharide--protein glycosyltransferase
LISNLKLFKVGTFEFHLHHLLIIGILAISFSISVMVRSQAADYGFQLNEFDPFFNFRATQYLLDHGVNAYVHWHDDMSWYPNGRDVYSTSQVPLHFTAAFLYKIFGAGSSLYDFTIIFPVVFGSLTTIIVFALVRVIGGTTAGLFASLFFALSPPIIVRGTIGWFKSEPLGLFYGLLGLYLFLSGLKSQNRKIAFGKLIGGGLFLAIGFASWGGVEFFLMPLALFIVILPFIRKDHKFLLWAIPLFVAVTLVVSGGFARPGISFVLGLRGFALIGSTIFLVVMIFVQKFSREGTALRNSLAILGGSIIAGVAIISSNILHAPSFRYLNAINPFLTSQDALVDSVAEHATPNLTQNFTYFSVLMLFAGLGIWLIFRKKSENQNSLPIGIKNEMTVFALIIGIIGAYAGGTFARLDLLTATSVIILASIGLAVITSEILKKRTQVITHEISKKGSQGKASDNSKKGTIQSKKSINALGMIASVSYVVIIVALLLVPTIYPANGNWISGTKSPPTILNGGSNYAISTDDWPATLDWIKNNTPTNSVVASWWDYGYWIQTLGGRTTLADNATLSTNVIAKIAQIFLSSPDEAWKMLHDWGANYVLVYVVGQQFSSNGQTLYVLGGGGDESKKQWFMRIAGADSSKFLQGDQFTPTDYFWQNTLLGKMFPFTPVTYFDPNTHVQSATYQSGYIAVYSKTIKYPVDGNGPLKLVYSSPSLNSNSSGIISGVLLYQVNPNYVPETSNTNQEITPQVNSTNVSPTSVNPTSDVGVISTKYGNIVIKFRDDVAPKTVANFEKLAKSGFYDETIFHRIIPGFVIQGGDPNTKNGSRDTWGTGDAGYTIPPEFSTLKHVKYMVSMARGPSINSASSQFFIMLGDATNLDGKYTIFGQVISGQDIVDKIGAIKTDPATDQPLDPEEARMSTVVIQS